MDLQTVQLCIQCVLWHSECKWSCMTASPHSFSMCLTEDFLVSREVCALVNLAMGQSPAWQGLQWKPRLWCHPGLRPFSFTFHMQSLRRVQLPSQSILIRLLCSLPSEIPLGQTNRAKFKDVLTSRMAHLGVQDWLPQITASQHITEQLKLEGLFSC